MRSRSFDSTLFWSLFFSSLCIVAMVMPAAAAIPTSVAVRSTADRIISWEAGDRSAQCCDGHAAGRPSKLD
jgi:hypothetical protein